MSRLDNPCRRRMLRVSLPDAGVLISTLSSAPALSAEKAGRGKKRKGVGAVEDLMREHGVSRRALLAYFETVPKLRANLATVDVAAIARTANLFRSFGEDYHERMLEEAHRSSRLPAKLGSRR
jgi:hypothetical protein